MPHYETVAAFFQQHMEHLSLSVDAIADVTGNAAMAATEAIFAERKLFSCGVGVDVASAVAFSEFMRRGLKRERPALPVVELCTRHSEPLEGGVRWLGEQITALGQPGDMAILFSGTLQAADLDFLANALNKRQMNSVWIGAQGPGPSLVFPGADVSTVLTLSHASALCLAELIDVSTFGPLEDTP